MEQKPVLQFFYRKHRGFQQKLIFMIDISGHWVKYSGDVLESPRKGNNMNQNEFVELFENADEEIRIRVEILLTNFQQRFECEPEH